MTRCTAPQAEVLLSFILPEHHRSALSSGLADLEEMPHHLDVPLGFRAGHEVGVDDGAEDTLAHALGQDNREPVSGKMNIEALTLEGVDFLSAQDLRSCG